MHVEFAGRSRPLRSPFRVGAAADCDLSLPDEGIRPLHGLILHLESGWVWVDVAADGTSFLNGEALPAHHALRDGDVLTLGPCALLIKEDGGTSRSHEAPPMLGALDGVNRIFDALRGLRGREEHDFVAFLGQAAQALGADEASLHGERGPLRWPEGLSAHPLPLLPEAVWPELDAPCLLEPSPAAGAAPTWHGAVPLDGTGSWKGLELVFSRRPPAAVLPLLAVTHLGLRARLVAPAPRPVRPALDGTATWTR